MSGIFAGKRGDPQKSSEVRGVVVDSRCKVAAGMDGRKSRWA